MSTIGIQGVFALSASWWFSSDAVGNVRAKHDVFFPLPASQDVSCTAVANGDAVGHGLSAVLFHGDVKSSTSIKRHSLGAEQHLLLLHSSVTPLFPSLWEYLEMGLRNSSMRDLPGRRGGCGGSRLQMLCDGPGLKLDQEKKGLQVLTFMEGILFSNSLSDGRRVGESREGMRQEWLSGLVGACRSECQPSEGGMLGLWQAGSWCCIHLQILRNSVQQALSL